MFRLCAPPWTPSENICVFPSRCRTPRCTQPASGPSGECWLVSGIQIVLFRDMFLQTSPAFSPWQPGSRAATEAGGLGGSRGMPWRGEAHDGVCALQSFGMRECPNSTPDPSPAHGLGSSGLSFLICEMGAEGAQPSLCDSEGYMTSGIVSKLRHLPPLPPVTSTSSSSSSSSLHALPSF